MREDMKYIKSDPRRYDMILPTRVVHTTEGVENAEWILKNTDTQSHPLAETCTVLSTKGGKKAAILVDFGTELYGGIQVITQRIDPIDSVAVRIRFGESANEALAPIGWKGCCNHHGAREFDILLPPNGCTRVGNLGFRFACIELTQPDAVAPLYALQGVCCYRDIPYRGTFRCGDEYLNRIYDTCAYTVHLCMQDYIWDGIKRDRVPFIGDLHPEMLAIRTVFGPDPLMKDTMRYVAEQRAPDRCPNNLEAYSLWYLIILWDWYVYTGDKAMLEELAFYWKPLLRRLLSQCVHTDDGPVLRAGEMGHCHGFFLDWPTNGYPEAEDGVYALFVLALQAARGLCEMTRERELAEECHSKELLLSKGPFKECKFKQISAFLHMASLVDLKDGAVLTEGGAKGLSTFMSYYILKVIAQTAGVEPALSILREYYGAMLDVGATTFWEDFDMDWVRPGATITEVLGEGEYDIHGDNGAHCYVGYRCSFCHGWSSAPAAFLAETVLGCQILEPGCRKLRVTPQLGWLSWAEGTVPTPLGDVQIRAEKKNGETVVSIQAPEGIQIEY